MEYEIGEEVWVRPRWTSRWVKGIVLGIVGHYNTPLIEYVLGRNTYRATFKAHRIGKIETEPEDLMTIDEWRQRHEDLEP